MKVTNCEFNPNKCDLRCPKYPMCSHYFIETQLSEIQTQIQTIYTALTKLILDKKKNEENLENLTALVNEYFQRNILEKDPDLNQNLNEESL